MGLFRNNEFPEPSTKFPKGVLGEKEGFGFCNKACGLSNVKFGEKPMCRWTLRMGLKAERQGFWSMKPEKFWSLWMVELVREEEGVE